MKRKPADAWLLALLAFALVLVVLLHNGLS